MPRNRNSHQAVSASQAIRDVFIASMRYGQFPFAALAFIACVLLYRMPSEDISRLIFEILNGFMKGYLVGFGLFVLTALGWFIHARYQRRIINAEIERIGKEKSALQKEVLGDKIQSTNPRANRKARGA